MWEKIMPNIEKIRLALSDMNLSAVSEATGINKHVLYAFVSGKTTPRYDSMLKLVKYLQARESLLDG